MRDSGGLDEDADAGLLEEALGLVAGVLGKTVDAPGRTAGEDRPGLVAGAPREVGEGVGAAARHEGASEDDLA
eukprot:10227598-Alexandrium_andersonii.AAC.1